MQVVDKYGNTFGQGHLIITSKSGKSKLPVVTVAWGNITGALIDQTDLQDALNLKVPTARTITINGVTQDLTANRTWTISTGITVDTTPITGGVSGRLLFDNAGTVGETSGINWNSSTATLSLLDSPFYSQAGNSSTNTAFSITGTASSDYTIYSSRQFIFNTGQSMYFNTDTDGGSALDRAWYFAGARTGITGGRTYGALTVDSSGFPSFTLYNNDNGARILLASNATSYFNGGNLLIGTTTDAGYKLDVNGVTRVVAADNENIFTVSWGGSNSVSLGSNTANSPTLRLGSIRITAHPGGSSLSFSNGFLTTVNVGANTNSPMTIAPYVTGTSTGNIVLLSSGARISAHRHVPTSGVLNMVMVGGAAANQYMDFSPASGNAEFNQLNILNQINTSGTYAGIVRGIYYNPILTSVTGVTHRAIETTRGDILFKGGNPNLIFQETTAAINTASTTSILFGASTTSGYGAGIFSIATQAYNRSSIIIASGGATDTSNVTIANANIEANPGSTNIYKTTTIQTNSLTFRSASQNTGALSMFWTHAETKVALFSNSLGSYGRGDFRVAILNSTSGTVALADTRFMITGDTYNVLINTTTDAGYKLDVNGTARVTSTLSSGGQIIASFGFLQIGANANVFPGLINHMGANQAVLGLNTTRINAQTDLSVGFIGGADASAVIETRSTTKGFLPPRMTNAQMLAIATPAEGLMVYDTTNRKLCCYDGVTWQNLF